MILQYLFPIRALRRGISNTLSVVFLHEQNIIIDLCQHDFLTNIDTLSQKLALSLFYLVLHIRRPNAFYPKHKNNTK